MLLMVGCSCGFVMKIKHFLPPQQVHKKLLEHCYRIRFGEVFTCWGDPNNVLLFDQVLKAQQKKEIVNNEIFWITNELT